MRRRFETATFSPTLIRALEHFAREEKATCFNTLLAAFAVLLHRYTGQGEMSIGSVFSDDRFEKPEQPSAAVENPVARRIDLSDNPSFRTVVGRIRRVSRGDGAGSSNRHVPWLQMIDALQGELGIGRDTLSQVMFATCPVRHGSEVPASADLAMAIDLGGGVDPARATLYYNADVFDRPTAARMLEHYHVVLAAAVTGPTRTVSELPLIRDAERRQLFAWSSEPPLVYPRNTCIHQLFETQAQQTPDAPALVGDGEALTYRALNERANQIAHYLRSRGIRRGAVVGVCLERSLELVTTVLGVLKAGAAYVGLDPAERPDRLAYLVRDAGMPLLVGHDGARAWLAPGDVTLVNPDCDHIAGQSTADLTCDTTADDLAYVLYTSGTTGNPKGVEVPHRGIVRLVYGLACLPVGPQDVFLQLTSLSFDLSTFEIWHPLLHGARLAVFPGRFESLQDLESVLKRRGVTCLWLTASVFNAVIDEDPRALSGVRHLFIGGEALSVPHVTRALALLPCTRIINGYGPTEATTFTHCYEIPRDFPSAARSVPLGRPIGATDAWILDRHLNPVPIGVPGDLYVGGDGLALGYRNQPVLTAAKFIRHPFGSTEGARLYNTGDRARYLPDGNVEFLGRSDHQVKIRGFRVELEGIEATLKRHPSVKQAAVTYDPAGQRLLAHLVITSDLAGVVPGLRAFAESLLPDYMVPSEFIIRDALPLTVSGKVDRRALTQLGRSSHVVRHDGPEARTETERRIAAIWSVLFDIPHVGIHDNFFHLGGHSLLAARLFARIERAFGKKLCPSTLLTCPTIAQLAVLVENTAGPTPEPALLPIQTRGSRPPLFCVTGIGGGVLGLAKLGRHLGDDQPVFALRTPVSELDGDFSIEEMAARYVDEVLGVAPRGPHYLAGYSSGGILAFEMARQLRARGLPVALVAVLDQCPFENRPALTPPGLRLLIQLLRNFPFWFIDDFLLADAGEMLGRVRSHLRLHWAKLRRAVAGGEQVDSPPDVRDVLGLWRFPDGARRLLEAEYEALKRYAPASYAGRVTLFRARAGPLLRSYRPDMGWGDVTTGPVDVVVVPGSHASMLAEPYVRAVANQLRARLAGAAVT